LPTLGVSVLEIPPVSVPLTSLPPLPVVALVPVRVPLVLLISELPPAGISPFKRGVVLP
jgi:hypothetical protein